MTDENPKVEQTEQSSLFIGTRLKEAREALGLSVKDVSYQLRLNENIIKLIETDQLPGDLPLTFARGYLRTYAKFLNLREDEINSAISTLFPDAEYTYTRTNTTEKSQAFISNQRVMQLTTSLITITLVGLVVTWWFNHDPNSNSTPMLAENITKEPIPLPTKIELSQSITTASSIAAAPTVASKPNDIVAINVPQKIEIKPKPVIEEAKPSTQQVAANNDKTDTQAIHLADNKKPSVPPYMHDDDDEDDEYDDDNME